jgi:bifunctional non-homologous end joining protein LigD
VPQLAGVWARAPHNLQRHRRAEIRRFPSLAVIGSGTCRLVSRNGNDYKSFPGLCASLAQLPHEAILDGEIVCLDGDGCPQFDQLFYRRGEPYFYAFDAPYVDGQDLRESPLIERKRILRQIGPHEDSRLLYVSHIEERGADLYREVCQCDLEGIVAKWKHGHTCPAMRRTG